MHVDKNSERDRLRESVLDAVSVAPTEKRPLKPLTDYAELASPRSWQQRWDPGARALQDEPISMTGTVWSAAIERSIEEQNGVYIPAMPEPVWLDRSIVVTSGSQIVVDPNTEIRMIIGDTEHCLLHNRNLVSGQQGPVELCANADRDILIEGGIWSDQKNSGHGPQGFRKGKEGLMLGSQGCFVLSNVENTTIRNVTVRDNSSFGVQIGNARNFVVEGICVDGTKDGVHVEGPTEFGVIRDVKGPLAGDDVVALNAWDWRTSSLTFGSITDILVEDTDVDTGACAIRVLPGVKIFPDGSTLACDVLRCLFSNIRNCHSFKMYDQPNVRCITEDFSGDLGHIRDVYFENVHAPGLELGGYYDTSKKAVFELCEHACGLHFDNIHLDYAPGEPYPEYLLSIGPKSLVRPAYRNRSVMRDIFNPSARPVTDGITVKNIYLKPENGAEEPVKCDAPETLIYRAPEFV